MASKGWTRSQVDPQLFMHDESKALLVAHDVDDIIMTAPQEWEQTLREDIESAMKMKWGDHITEAGWT
eukprot:10166151-Heterocapsa_arctica.AAC.1